MGGGLGGHFLFSLIMMYTDIPTISLLWLYFRESPQHDRWGFCVCHHFPCIFNPSAGNFSSLHRDCCAQQVLQAVEKLLCHQCPPARTDAWGGHVVGCACCICFVVRLPVWRGWTCDWHILNLVITDFEEVSQSFASLSWSALFIRCWCEVPCSSIAIFCASVLKCPLHCCLLCQCLEVLSSSISVVKCPVHPFLLWSALFSHCCLGAEVPYSSIAVCCSFQQVPTEWQGKRTLLLERKRQPEVLGAICHLFRQRHRITEIWSPLHSQHTKNFFHNRL